MNSSGQYEDDDSGWAVCLRGGVSKGCGDTTLSKSHNLPDDVGFRSLIARPDSYIGYDKGNDNREPHRGSGGISLSGVSTMEVKSWAGSKKKRASSSRRKRRRISTQNDNKIINNNSDPLACPPAAAPATTVEKQTNLATLFFPRLPVPLQDAAALASIVGRPLEAIRIITRTDGRRLAWASFDDKITCASTLSRLRVARPDLGAQLHRAPHSRPSTQFDKRLAVVQRNGGVGNTLLFTNLPADVGCDEFSEVISRHSGPVTPLRTRTAVAGNGRGVACNFWCVFANVDACRLAYESVQSAKVTFRCGLSVTLCPNIHDDSTDADESRRRARALQLVSASAVVTHNIPTTPQLQLLSQTQSGPSAVQCLEDFLRSKLRRFVLLTPTSNEAVKIHYLQFS